MASTTEESHEVKAIKLHITTLKSQISITTNNVSSAKSNIDAAIAMYAALQSQLDVSKKELKDVEKLLVEAEQRAFADNDVNDNVNNEGGSNKRRKVSPPPQDDTNNSAGVIVKKEEEDGNAYDEETDKEDGDKEDGKEEDDDGSTKPPAINNVSANNNNPAGSQSNDNMNRTTGSISNNHEALGSGNATSSTAARQSTSVNNVNQVIVEGCGLSVLNGIYTKAVRQTFDGAPVPLLFAGAPVYRKGVYVIYRDSMSMGPCNWFIGGCDGFFSKIGKHNPYYRSPNNADSMTPPTNGWEVHGFGASPAPKIQLVTANNDANSEGAKKVSGSIGSFSTAGPSPSDQSSRATSTAARQSTSVNNVNQVIVEGCGMSYFNGTYTKVIGQTSDGAPVYSQGRMCVIYRDSMSMEPNSWYISNWNGNISDISDSEKAYYGSPNNADSMTPPTNGWVVLLNGYGLNPAPNLQLATANNNANSEGAQKVSGSTGSSSTAGPSSAAQSSRDVTQVLASSDAWKVLMKHFSFTFYGGKYCFPGKENRPLKDSSAVLGVNYFSTIEELRQHLRTFGLPKATGQLDRDLKDSLLHWVFPDHIVVSECGNVELNGRYQRECITFRGLYNGAPVYTKKGEWKGKKVTFAIFREPSMWYIGRSNARQGNYEAKERTLFKCESSVFNILLPPKKGWIIIGTTRGGVNPAPTLSY